jgi:hypothetical protein
MGGLSHAEAAIRNVESAALMIELVTEHRGKANKYTRAMFDALDEWLGAAAVAVRA